MALRQIQSIRTLVLAVSLLAVLSATGLTQEPITGPRLDSLLAARNLPLESALAEIFPESDGYFITGPFDPFLGGSPEVRKILYSTRVICPDLVSLKGVIERLKLAPAFTVGEVQINVEKARKKNPVGYRGILAQCTFNGTTETIQFLTPNYNRWLMWAERTMWAGLRRGNAQARLKYAVAVSDYLHQIDQGLSPEPPAVADLNLPTDFAFYAPPPDFVIQGYDNYLEFLHRHEAMYTTFATGILSFVPSDSLLAAMKDGAPGIAYPNKEEPRLQEEYRKFFSRGGDVRTMTTLTRDAFDTLQPGEYFYCVGITGKVRFGRELPREEVERLEAETGHKIPRGNHAFLFHGEPVLTAGAFFVTRDSAARVREANVHSGHYFYSNVTPSVRTDIAERSNDYLWTIGHFFTALDSLGIPYDEVLISKF